MSLILIVEDNRNLASGLQTNLECEGHQVEIAFDGSSGLIQARTARHDLIILDLMLPGMDGYRVLDSLRRDGVETPVIVLTARGDEDDKVRGLLLGADDYVTKPFGIRELTARVAAHLRRAKLAPNEEPAETGPLTIGPVVLDPATHRVLRHGMPVHLRPKEYDLLVCLMRRGGRIVSRARLLQEVWGYHESVRSRTLDTHVAALRRKLEDDPANPTWLLTVRQSGYRLNGGEPWDLSGRSDESVVPRR